MSAASHRDVFMDEWRMFEVTIPSLLNGIPFYVEGELTPVRLHRRTFVPQGAIVRLSQRYTIRDFAGAHIKVLRAKWENKEGYIPFDLCKKFLESIDIDCLPHVSIAKWSSTGE